MRALVLATPREDAAPAFVVEFDHHDPDQLAALVGDHVADVRGLIHPVTGETSARLLTVLGSSATGAVWTDVRLTYLARQDRQDECPRCSNPETWAAVTADPQARDVALGCWSCGWLDAGETTIVRATEGARS